MTDIHPDIKSYWEKYHGGEASMDESGAYWYVPNVEPSGAFIIAMKGQALKSFRTQSNAPFSDEEWVYFLMGATYSEEEMLRVLKLKAFL